MTTIRLAAALLAATVLAVPAFAEDPAPATPAAPAIAPPVAPPTTGRVYISYPVQDKATYDSQFAIDDAWLADAIKPGTCVYFDLPPGKHTMHTTATANWYVELAAGDGQICRSQISRRLDQQCGAGRRHGTGGPYGLPQGDTARRLSAAG